MTYTTTPCCAGVKSLIRIVKWVRGHIKEIKGNTTLEIKVYTPIKKKETLIRSIFKTSAILNQTQQITSLSLYIYQ